MRNESLISLLKELFPSDNQTYWRSFQQQIYDSLSTLRSFPRSWKTLMGCSTLIMLLLYCLFFSLSCFVKIFSDVKWRWDSEFVLVILTLKKAFCPSRQNPLARTSGFALTPARPLMISPSNGCRGGSISTSSQISVSNWASKYITLLWRIATNPPVLQFSVCVMLKDCPHGHLDGSPFKSFSVS